VTLLQGYTYQSGFTALCYSPPSPPINPNAIILSVMAAVPSPAGSATISPGQLSSAAAAIIQQSGVGSPTQTTQAANGPANATAAFTFNSQTTVDSAASALGTSLNSLAANAGLPPGSTITVLGATSGPTVYSCSHVPAALQKLVGAGWLATSPKYHEAMSALFMSSLESSSPSV